MKKGFSESEKLIFFSPKNPLPWNFAHCNQMSWWRCFASYFFFPMPYVAFHWYHANEVPGKPCQLKIFAMDFRSPFRSWGWSALPRLCNTSDVTAIIQDVFFSTWGKSRETQMCELLIKCLWLNVEVFCGRESISHSAHPNTNHYLAFLIKDCTLVWWQVPPKARTDDSTFPWKCANFQMRFVYACRVSD